MLAPRIDRYFCVKLTRKCFHLSFRATSTDRQFLADFVAGEASTAGGRLARWLSPAPRIEPLKSEIKKPTIMPRIGVKLKIAVIVRDQYEDEVTSDAVKVEVRI